MDVEGNVNNRWHYTHMFNQLKAHNRWQKRGRFIKPHERKTGGNKSWARLDFSQKSQPLDSLLNDGVFSQQPLLVS